MNTDARESDHSRRQSDAMLALVQEIQDDVSDMKTILDNHIQTEPREWASVLERLLARAFPDGDPEGHKAYHCAVVKKAEKQAEFWEKMRYELFKWGLFGFTLWALKAMYDAGVAAMINGLHSK